MIQTVLLTGFEPFSGDVVNPSWEAVSLVPTGIGGCTVRKALIPVSFRRSEDALEQALREYRPDAVILTGLAGGRKEISLERVAVNLRDARIPDNDGFMPRDQEVIPGGPAVYFTRLPVRRIHETLSGLKIPCSLSLSAGSFVCNDLFYWLLHYTAPQSLPCGFIHVPYLPEQGTEKNAPSLPKETVTAALAEIIRILL